MARGKVRTDTRQFENSHACKPRGYGHWIFEVSVDGYLRDEFMRVGNFGEARDSVVEAVRSTGLYAESDDIVIDVLP